MNEPKRPIPPRPSALARGPVQRPSAAPAPLAAKPTPLAAKPAPLAAKPAPLAARPIPSAVKPAPTAAAKPSQGKSTEAKPPQQAPAARPVPLRANAPARARHEDTIASARSPSTAPQPIAEVRVVSAEAADVDDLDGPTVTTLDHGALHAALQANRQHASQPEIELPPLTLELDLSDFSADDSAEVASIELIAPPTPAPPQRTAPPAFDPRSTLPLVQPSAAPPPMAAHAGAAAADPRASRPVFDDHETAFRSGRPMAPNFDAFEARAAQRDWAPGSSGSAPPSDLVDAAPGPLAVETLEHFAPPSAQSPVAYNEFEAWRPDAPAAHQFDEPPRQFRLENTLAQQPPPAVAPPHYRPPAPTFVLHRAHDTAKERRRAYLIAGVSLTVLLFAVVLAIRLW